MLSAGARKPRIPGRAIESDKGRRFTGGPQRIDVDGARLYPRAGLLTLVTSPPPLAAIRPRASSSGSLTTFM